MKAPLSWLADYVDLPGSIDDLVLRLIMSGTEVEDVVRVGEHWQDVRTARIIALERPPGSNRLHVATIEMAGETLCSVTAAPNVEVGQTVPAVRVGGVVPRDAKGRPFVLQPRPMMGITGDAMLLSADELGISEDHDGILVLPPETPVGRPLLEIMGDTILDVQPTANRPDEMSMVGIAREIAAATETFLREPDTSLPAGTRVSDESSIPITVEDSTLCARYTGLRIEGVRVGPSPSWLSRKLEAAGVRSINNVVDAGNFVMLELGQPVHAFDYHRLRGAAVGVRVSRAGERLTTLDGVDRAVPEGTLLITDGEGPVAIAGIMGGAGSEVSDDTRALLLESANFDRVSIRRSSRALGLRTEASARFERGVPPELTELAARRFVAILASINPEPLTVFALSDEVGRFPPISSITATPEAVGRLLGVETPAGTMVPTLERLGFEVQSSDGTLTIHPPFWRRDVEGVADIAEEVARSRGYDQIPETLPAQDIPPAPLPPDLAWEDAIRDILLGIGFAETWTDTLTGRDALERLLTASPSPAWEQMVVNLAGLHQHGATPEPVALINAPTRERAILRGTLLSSLLDVVAGNLKHTRERLAFFELSRTFFPRAGDLPYERRTLGIALAGDREARAWNRRPEPYDFFDLKGAVWAVVERLGLSGMASVEQLDRPIPFLHPGRAARLLINGADAGLLGDLHPTVAERFEIEPPTRALVAELDLDTLMAAAHRDLSIRQAPRFPSVKRDISVSFPADVPAHRVEEIVRAEGGELLRSVRFVDVYAGPGVGPDRKSLSMALDFQSKTQTLTQEQAAAVQDRIVRALQRELGGTLRGSPPAGSAVREEANS